MFWLTSWQADFFEWGDRYDMPTEPTLLWLRRDLRLGDHPGWRAALASDTPVIPVFIRDPLVDASYGAAPLWRLGQSLGSLSRDIAQLGSRLVLRRGDALQVLRALIAETGARHVVWSRLYDPSSIERDREIKAALQAQGVETTSVNSSLLFEPWTVATQSGGYYRVYSPFWRTVRTADVASLLGPPPHLAPPDAWPASDRLQDWQLGRAMGRGAAIVSRHAVVGEGKARERLDAFLAEKLGAYKVARDRPDLHATSGLSENLACGEISPRTVWAAGVSAMERLAGHAASGAEHFLRELAWREFAYHLLYHSPELETRNWRVGWEAFPWRGDNPEAELWRRGMTGFELVDAGMREMFVTGTMHNRVRMLVASVLTKHLMTDWTIGANWFRDCLIDWDPASNAMGWQWTAGCGPDAAPYFRIFNPLSQAEKFDPDGAYRDRWLVEGRQAPSDDAVSYFDAIPREWGLSADQARPQRVISHMAGRQRALDAFDTFRSTA